MRLDRLITLGLFHPLRSIGLGAHGRRLPVLMYHSITDDPESGTPPYYRTCTSPRRFAEQMAWLAAAGWRGVTLSEGLESLAEDPEVRGKSQEPGAQTQEPRPQSPLPRSAPQDAAPGTNTGLPADNNGENPSPPAKLVAITFDDGFRDFHTAACPILQHHGFSATMYLPTAYIGDDRRSFKAHECLIWTEVRELAASGMEFGSHTVNHPRLAGLSWEEIAAELRDSKAVIEQRLERPALTFAYPYAFPQEEEYFTLRFHELLEATGYQSCVTTTIGRVAAGSDPLYLARLPANSDDDRALLMAKLAGAYDWLALPQKMGKSTRRLLAIPPRGSHSTPPLGPLRPGHS